MSKRFSDWLRTSFLFAAALQKSAATLYYLFKFKNCLHKCHRLVTIWLIVAPCEPSSFHLVSQGSHFHLSVKLVKPLWRRWFHTGALWFNELHLGETCEGSFQSFFIFRTSFASDFLFFRMLQWSSCYLYFFRFFIFFFSRWSSFEELHSGTSS